MRPDPWQKKKSRQYQAKQRARGDPSAVKKKTIVVEVEAQDQTFNELITSEESEEYDVKTLDDLESLTFDLHMNFSIPSHEDEGHENV